MKNIAIFGGSFDPPHNGHLEIIKKLNYIDTLDLILVIPAFINPFKNKINFNANLRLKCLKILTKDLSKVIISDYEIKNKIYHTINTINYFKKKCNPKNVFLVIGADILESIKKWYKYQEIINDTTLIVATRDKINIPCNLIQININSNCSSNKIKENIFNNIQDSNVESCIPYIIKNIIKNEVRILDIQNKLDFITKILDDKKASDIVTFDLSNTNYITKYVILATSMAEKHGLSLLDTLKESLKENNEKFYGIDEDNPNWIIADLGDIMIHIFTKETREKFNLEEFLNEYKQGKYNSNF